MPPVVFLCRAVMAWMAGVTAVIAWCASGIPDGMRHFYRVGPSDDLFVMGFAIDTPGKYGAIVTYCMCNAVVRVVMHDVVSPWLVLNVQDVHRAKTPHTMTFAHEVATMASLYSWLDWVLCMGILMAQADLCVIEAAASIVVTNVTTHVYIHGAHPNTLEQEQAEEREPLLHSVA